jgi:hypothetical protein
MFITLDIETIAGTDVPEDLLKVDSRLKDPDKIAKAKEEARQKTSFDGAFGEIVSIAWAVDGGDISSSTREYAGEEKLLRAAVREIDEDVRGARDYSSAHDYAIKWVGHNIEFDLGFIFKRCVVHGISLPSYFPWPIKPWDRFINDTGYMWGGAKEFVKLDTLAYALLGERKTNSGADVAGMWERGECDKIAEYNRDDVRLTREIHKKLIGVRNG